MLWKLILGNPWIFGGIAAAFIALAGWGFLEHEWRQAAVKGEAAARLESDLHEADATRYRASDEALRKVVAGLNERIDRQNTAVDRANAAKTRAETFAADAAQEATQAQQDLTALTLRTMERAHAHPEDVHRLGGPACDVYRSLYGKAAACTTPRTDTAP